MILGVAGDEAIEISRKVFCCHWRNDWFPTRQQIVVPSFLIGSVMLKPTVPPRL